jgi:ATP-dependent DNA helicase RecG
VDLFAEPLDPLVGPKTAAVLASSIGALTVGDLLQHYPRRYAERGELTDFASLQQDEFVTVLARVERVSVRPMAKRKGKIVDVVVTDGVGRLALTWFNQPWHAKNLTVGRVGLFSGKVGSYRGKRQLANAEYQLMASGEGSLGAVPLGEVDPGAELEAVAEFTGSLLPVYPAAASMQTWRIAQCMAKVLDTLPEDLPDPLPEDVRRERGLIGLREALFGIHRPATRSEVDRAVERLRFDEAFILQTVLAQRRAALDARRATAREPKADGLLAAFDAALPFTLTAGQVEVSSALATELARPHPMHRLLQGEVGSGKTVVALRAMLAVIDAGGQAALLAPTEVLAQQHFRSMLELLGPLAHQGMLGGSDIGTRVVLLTGSTTTANRRKALLDIVSGEAGLVVGTHALLEDVVQFYDLGLLVVDEQHRFGVEQRAALTRRGEISPHVLVMTATPIPRTVAMTVFGDLETSVLTELPRGRSPITTHVVPSAEKPHFVERAWQRVREEVESGHQVYVVCPRIGDDEGKAVDVDVEEPIDADLDPDDDSAAARVPAQAVLDLLPTLVEGPLVGLRVEMLHGRMKSDAKDTVMRDFAAGRIDVLVATTVIEVGVDVANATVMVVMDAERFGVSQLHQLRGRVGRGSAPGLCLLLTAAERGSPARDRLDAVASTNDGFELSRLDLRQRREGDVLGSLQSGRRSSLRLLSVLRDEDVIWDAREAATEVVAPDPELMTYPALRAAVQRARADESVDFIDKA